MTWLTRRWPQPFTLLWKQYDFDYSYAIEVFKFQLEKTAEFLESDKAWTLGAKDRAKRIRTVIKLMDKVYDDEYECEFIDKLKEKYGKDVLDWHFIPCEDKPGYSELKHECEFWSNAEQIAEELRILSLEAQEKQRKAHRILWQLIEKDIQGWWD